MENATPSTEPPPSSDPSQAEARTTPPPLFGARRSVADELKLPRSGYFSIADTKAEVYSKAGQVFDPRSTGGRYKSSFIWNTNWSEALSRQESLQRKADKAAADRKSASSSSTIASAGFQGPASAASKIDNANGFVSFTRMADLDRMDIDLSAQLRPRAPKVAAQVDPAVAAAALATANRRRALNTFTDAGGQTFSRKEVGRLGRTSASQVSQEGLHILFDADSCCTAEHQRHYVLAGIHLSVCSTTCGVHSHVKIITTALQWGMIAYFLASHLL